MQNMDSEQDRLNDQAVRVRPLQRYGIEGIGLRT
jgi:hypothetical protein